jgi:hypothetical protein
MLDRSQEQQQVSKKSFAEYGILHMAYVKRAVVDGYTVYAVHAADGTYLWHYADEAVARAALRQQELNPLSVH